MNISKIVSTGLLAILSVLELVRFSLLKNDELVEAEVVGADFASSSVKLATYLLAIILVLSSKRSGDVLLIVVVVVVVGQLKGEKADYEKVK